jgi:predicted ATPase
MSAVLGSQYGATTVAAENLIAQLQSQGKLTTGIHRGAKIEKFDTKLKFLKQKNPLHMCRNFISIE